MSIAETCVSCPYILSIYHFPTGWPNSPTASPCNPPEDVTPSLRAGQLCWGVHPSPRSGSQPTDRAGVSGETCASPPRAGSRRGTGPALAPEFPAGIRPRRPQWHLPENVLSSPGSLPSWVSWDHLPGKLLALGSLSQNPPLEEPALRQCPTTDSLPSQLAASSLPSFCHLP